MIGIAKDDRSLLAAPPRLCMFAYTYLVVCPGSRGSPYYTYIAPCSQVNGTLWHCRLSMCQAEDSVQRWIHPAVHSKQSMTDSG